MKKLAAILTFLCLLLLIGGHVLVFGFRLAEVKSEARAELKNGSSQRIVQLQFSATEAAALHWDDDEEFSYNGTLYDVVKKVTTTGKTTIYCIADGAETLLVDNYLKLHQPQGGQPSQVLLKLLSANFLLPASTTQTLLPKETVALFATASSPLYWLFKNVPAPPPWA